MRSRLPSAALAILAAVLPLAGAGNSLDDVVRTVQEALRLQQTDADLARALHRLNLNLKIDNRTAEELESEAPGPRSIAELERLSENSRDMPLPRELPRFASPPEPTLDELREVLGEARRKALAYTAGLPDFLCTETVRRYQQFAAWPGWTLQDTLTLQLTYFGHQEKYKLTAMNGRATSLTYDQVGGALSEGEFGSMLHAVFTPASLTAFQWSNWTTLRKRPAYVLAYQIDAATSVFHLTGQQTGGRIVSTVVGEHGLVYIDRETRDVIRMDSQAVSIPRDFPMKGATRTLDYGPAEVGGRGFLLPLHAEVRLMPTSGPTVKRNQIDFSDYRKFTGESTIVFGDSAEDKPAPVPPVKK